MRALIAPVVAFALTACSATPYQPLDYSGGFFDTQLDTNQFRVSFRTNSYTDVKQAVEMALLRSAEVTLKSGFQYFIIVDEKWHYDHAAFAAPTESATSRVERSDSRAAPGNSTAAATAGQAVRMAPPSTMNTIICFTRKPQVDGLVYDATSVFESLSKKYGVAPGKK